ncbi:MAG: amidohydrolase family protein [candidate division Zixibacteria bacterium]|nr:amidohydrolase family protein [candidate division Zixibacteria bacterium]
MSEFILTAPYIFTNSEDYPLLKSGAVLVENGIISEISSTGDAKRKHPDIEEINFSEGLLTPGLVNLHHHLYSSFACGWNPGGSPPEDFLQILNNVWWKLDKSLQLEDIYYSAMIGLCQSLKMGVTSVVDHHASQRTVTGSLDSIAKAFKDVDVKGSICFELTDREGDKLFEEGLQETTDALSKWSGKSNSSKIMAMIGLHASFTLSDDSLKRISENFSSFDVGYHFHLAEDKSDQVDSIRQHGLRVTHRFEKFGILGPKSLAIHGVHLNDDEAGLLRETQTNLVLCARSNQNNAVSLPDWRKYDGVNIGLGTDGIGSDMVGEAKSALYISHHVFGDPSFGFADIGNMLLNKNPEILQKITGLKTGKIEPGYPADMVLWRYDPPTPLTDENILGHYFYGLYNLQADSVWVDGNMILKNSDFTNFHYAELVGESRLRAKKLWERM